MGLSVCEGVCVYVKESTAVVCQRGGCACVCAADVTEELCASECLCVRVSGEIMNISVWVRLYAGSLLGKHMYVPNYVSVSAVVCFA